MEKTLTKEQVKGVDLIVKTIKKVYPFVKEWKLTDNWAKYSTTLYLDLVIDLTKFSQYLNKEIEPYYLKKLENGETVRSAALMAAFDWGMSGTEEWEETGKMSGELTKKIKNDLNQAYEYIPDGMKMTWDATLTTNIPVGIGIDYFIMEL
jgi:hypothetical protein